MSNSNFTPKVSIIIPVYNGSNYLKEAIDSALAQTYRNIEILVINDGSNDEGKTDKICKSYGDKIRYFKKENGGVATALNMGVEKMKGEYFSWLSHDDVYYPEKVESQVSLLSNLPNKETVIYSGCEIIDSQGASILEIDYLDSYTKKSLNIPLFPFFNLCLNGCTMLIKKSLIIDVGGFNTGLPTTQDYDLWYRILKNNEIRYDSNINVLSRSHPGQESKIMLDQHISECNKFWLSILQGVSEEVMKGIYGSSELFYERLYFSFSEKTRYDEVINYLFIQTLQKLRTKYNNCSSSFEKRKILNEIHAMIKGETSSNANLTKRFLDFKEKGDKERVLFFTGYWYDRGGLNKMISKVSEMLLDSYEVIICCMREEGNNDGYEVNEKIEYIELEGEEFILLPKILKLLEIDVFVGSNNCFIPFLKLYKEISNLGVKTVMWNHEFYFLPYFSKDLEQVINVRKEVFKHVDVVLWLTETSAFLSRQFSDRVAVIGNVSPMKLISEGIKRENRDINIVSVGRFISFQKRIDLLLRMFAELLKSKPMVKLYIVGKYDLEMEIGQGNSLTVKDLILQLKIPSDKIIFTGEIKNVDEYYAQSYLNIMTSQREGFGLTILEAASFGVPSVIFGGGGSEDIITNDKDGYVINKGDFCAMAKRISFLIDDKVHYKRISKNTEKLVEKYSYENIKNDWLLLLAGLSKMTENGITNLLKKEFPAKSSISREKLSQILMSYEESIAEKVEDNYDLNEFKEQIVEKDEKIKKIENSKSWRLTKPLRACLRILSLIKLKVLKVLSNQG